MEKKNYHPYFPESLWWIPRKQMAVFLIFFNKFFFKYIYIYIYISGHLSYAKFIVVPKYIIGVFLSRNNISGAINVFLTLGIKQK